jgi:hypothetical protein
MPLRLRIWLLAMLLCLTGGSARADFVISISSVTVPQDGTGTVDVWLTSTASSSSPDLLNDYGFTLQITGPNELQFANTQSYGYLSSSQYVFAGDSDDQMTSSAGGTVTSSGPPNGYPNDTFVGYDSTFSGNPVSLSSANAPALLASLTLSAAITAVGDSYTIGLILPSGDGSISSSVQTYFDVLDFSGAGTETSSVPFTSTSGTVMISPAAVPEPASIVSALTGLLILIGFKRLRAIEERRVREIVRSSVGKLQG